MVVGPTGHASLFEDLVMVRQGDLGLFARLLVVSPGGLAIALLLSHSLVLLLHLLGIGSFSGCVFVLEYASHAKNGFFLRGPVGFLLGIGRSGNHDLTMLLVGPLALVLRIQPNSIEVHEIFAFKFTAS